ncbi:hypothetical protein Ancab_002275 [Ancistrocladus abbreviatus]
MHYKIAFYPDDLAAQQFGWPAGAVTDLINNTAGDEDNDRCCGLVQKELQRDCEVYFFLDPYLVLLVFNIAAWPKRKISLGVVLWCGDKIIITKAAAPEAAARSAKLAAAKMKEKNHYNQQPVR